MLLFLIKNQTKQNNGEKVIFERQKNLPNTIKELTF